MKQLPDLSAGALQAKSPGGFTHAFQPIVDVQSKTIFAHEALIRGHSGESAGALLSGLGSSALHELDRQSGTNAIVLAARLGMTTALSINSLPQSFGSAGHCNDLREVCQRSGFSLSSLIVEVTENEAIADLGSFTEAIGEYRRLGVQIAIDDFGAGHSGLNLLADFQPDLLKLDMNLVRSINSRGPRQAIVRAILQVCEDLAIEVIAEGVESAAERDWFVDSGVRLFQGYLFAKPGIECLPAVAFHQVSV